MLWSLSRSLNLSSLSIGIAISTSGALAQTPIYPYPTVPPSSMRQPLTQQQAVPNSRVSGDIEGDIITYLKQLNLPLDKFNQLKLSGYVLIPRENFRKLSKIATDLQDPRYNVKSIQDLRRPEIQDIFERHGLPLRPLTPEQTEYVKKVLGQLKFRSERVQSHSPKLTNKQAQELKARLALRGFEMVPVTPNTTGELRFGSYATSSAAAVGLNVGSLLGALTGGFAGASEALPKMLYIKGSPEDPKPSEYLRDSDSYGQLLNRTAEVAFLGPILGIPGAIVGGGLGAVAGILTGGLAGAMFDTGRFVAVSVKTQIAKTKIVPDIRQCVKKIVPKLIK